MATQAARQAEFARREQELAAAERPLLAALATVGVAVSSVWDLVNSKVEYPEAVPVLLRHLTADYPAAIRSAIARALVTPTARARWTELVELFRRESNVQVREALAIAVNSLAGPEHFEGLVGLVRDRSLGPDRAMFADGIGNFRHDAVVEILRELASDPDVAVATWRKSGRCRETEVER